MPLEVYEIERPRNGTVLLNELSGGSNRLTIKNQRGEDVVVVLTAPGDNQPPLLSVYVHGNSSHTVRGIRSGTYRTFYAEGSDWCSHYGRFTRNAEYGRFDEDEVYRSTSSTYTVVTLTFGATDGSWSPTHSLDPDDFPG